MRSRRLIHLAVTAWVSIVAVAALTTAASAQPAGGEGGGEIGAGDQYAGGQLLGDGSGAEVVAQDGADLGDQTAPRRGGGNVICRFYNESSGDPLNLSKLSPKLNGLNITVLRTCQDAATGEYASVDTITVVPPVVARPDPRDLARTAVPRLPLPLPDVKFSPPLNSPDDFLLVRLPTWIWVENWAEVSRTASAGGVTATATARPLRQVWDFTPYRSDRETEGGCAGPGTPYDPSKPPESQSTECEITFHHSSAGEPGAAYEGHLTVVYAVSWTSNIGAGGSLGTVARTVVVPVRVGSSRH